MVSPEYLMLLQITSLLKRNALAVEEMSEDDLHIVWVAYKNMFEFWSVAQRYNVAPPSIH